MKKYLLIFILAVTSFSYGQEIKKQNTKFEQFSSKTGTTVKFIDYNLPALDLLYGVTAESKIRKLISLNKTEYYYFISYESQYGEKSAAIAYEDLLELIKALHSLKTESSSDLASNPDYLENKFVTTDGFQLGYYVNKGELKWYVVLDKYSSSSTLPLSDVSTIENALNSAKIKIESLKK